MANKTFLELQTALCSMWGYESPADLLAQDLVDLKTFINAAYFDCFCPTDGTRGWWPEQYHSAKIPAMVETTLTMTADSKVVTGYAFDPIYAGSFVKIGERFFRFGERTGAGPYVYTLVQPWDGVTGPVAATVYHNAIALPWNIVELAGTPNLLGVGLLAPLPDQDAELNMRTEPAFDFQPRTSRQAFATARRQFSQAAYLDTGDPRFYHIDQAGTGATFAIGNRFHVYPLPETVYTFELRATVAPTSLTADADIPTLPAQTVDNILLPIARDKLAKNSANRRYTGGNVQYLSDEADRARSQLTSLRRVQRDVAGSFRLRRGW